MKKIKQLVSNGIKEFSHINFNLVKTLEPIDVSKKSNFEVYTLIDHDYVLMFLISIMSFKKCFNFNFNVSVYDNGSITKKDIELLKSKVRGIRIVQKTQREAKMQSFLNKYPMIKKYREKAFLMKKLIDCVYLSNNKILIALDTDIIFLGEATIKERELMVKDNNIVTSTYSTGKDSYFTLNGQSVYSNYFKKEYYNYFKKNPKFVNYMNIGFNKFYKKDIDFDEIENFLTFIDKATKEEMPKQKLWLTEQTCFVYLMAMKNKKVKFFSRKRFPIYKRQSSRVLKNAIHIHFPSPHRYVNLDYIRYFYKFIAWYKKLN